MANEAKPGAGVIVRTDFGGGVDQSFDAWRTPPNQLSILENGRLDRLGSVRKRTGYQTTLAPKAPAGLQSAGAPIAALAAARQTVVIDAARDNSLDEWSHTSSTSVRIANESGYVARNHTPSTAASNNGWTTTGPASDVISDVLMLDGNAGSVDECVDYAVDGLWIFVCKISRVNSNGETSTLTVSQYDSTTGALISEVIRSTWGGEEFDYPRIYPKMLIYPDNARIVVAVSYQSGVNQGSTDLLLYSYSAAGLQYVTSQNFGTVDYFNVTAYATVPEARYRPVCPFDVAKSGVNTLFLAQYTTLIGIDLRQIVVGTIGFTQVGISTTNPLGLDPIQALSIERTSGGIALVAVSVAFNIASTPPYVNGNYQVSLFTFNAITSALIASRINAVTTAKAATAVAPGRLTVGEYQAVGLVSSRICGLVEVLEFQQGEMYAHRLVRVGMDFSDATPPDDVTSRSYAIPAGRLFQLDYYPTPTSSYRTQLRAPLIVGASQQTFGGRVAVFNVPYTGTAGNYSGTIGTQILTGVSEFTVSACNSALQTFAPRLQPCPPPHPIKVSGVWHVPHLVALEGGTGFGIALIAMQQRAPGDSQPAAFGILPIEPAGLVQQSDGERFAEATLVDRPVIGAVVGINTGAVNDFTQGDYLIQAVATYRDAAGNMHRSTPSDPYRFIQGAPPNAYRQLQIWFSYQSYTNRNDAQIDFYITEPNGTILRYWFSVPNKVGESYAAWDRYDSQVGGEGLPALDAPTLYTTGGVLPYVPVPSARFGVLWKNRLVVGGADDKRSLYYSNAPLAYEAASFPVGNVIRLDHEQGCYACGTVNDKLILFSPTGVWGVFGNPRDETGAGGAITEPESLHDWIGCTQPISVVSIPTGLIFFGNDDRFYLIDERLQLQPIGLKVQSYTAETTFSMRLNEVRCVVHIEEEREVRFYMRDTISGTSGGILVYNYQVDQWSVDFSNAPEFGSTLARGACYSSTLSCLVISSSWLVDDHTKWLDGVTYIRLRAVTPWIQPGGTQDYARFRFCQFLGRSKDSHSLTVRVMCDFDESTIRSTGTWTAAQLAPVSNTVWPEQVRLQIGTQKTQAVKIEIYDEAGSGAITGEGPQLVGLALEMLPLGGAKRLPATRQR